MYTREINLQFVGIFLKHVFFNMRTKIEPGELSVFSSTFYQRALRGDLRC